MAWPTDDIITTSLDNDTDRPDRNAFLNLFRRVKQIIAARGHANGIASLDQNTKVPPSQLPDASRTTHGSVKLATSSEVQQGTDRSRAVTPESLQSLIATETRIGLVEKATDAEAAAGTDNTRYITARHLAQNKSRPPGITQIGSYILAYCQDNTVRGMTIAGSRLRWEPDGTNSPGVGTWMVLSRPVSDEYVNYRRITGTRHISRGDSEPVFTSYYRTDHTPGLFVRIS